MCDCGTWNKEELGSTSLERASQALNMVKDGWLRKAGRTPV